MAPSLFGCIETEIEQIGYIVVTRYISHDHRIIKIALRMTSCIYPQIPPFWEVAADPLLRKSLLVAAASDGTRGAGSCGQPAALARRMARPAKRLASWIPSLVDWQTRSTTPETTGFWFTLCWCASPYYLLLFCHQKNYEIRMVNKWQQAGWKRHLLPLLLISPPLFFLGLNLWSPCPSNNSVTLTVFTNRCCCRSCMEFAVT